MKLVFRISEDGSEIPRYIRWKWMRSTRKDRCIGSFIFVGSICPLSIPFAASANAVFLYPYPHLIQHKNIGTGSELFGMHRLVEKNGMSMSLRFDYCL
jgi:hypothetical protein